MSLNIRTPDPNQVFDIADPGRHGKIIKVGEQQSEVRFDDGAERVVSNAHLRPVGAPPVTDDGLCQHNPSPVSEVVRLGQQAMARKRRGWDDWLAIAEALQVGRTEVMRTVHTNEPSGRRYEKAMADWLFANGFKEIDKGTRKRLLDCLKRKAEIEKWRAQLTDSGRWKFNHPDTVLRKLTAVKDPPKISPVQKLKDELVAVIEERDLYKREVDRGGGDLWTPQSTPKQIAEIMVGKLTKSKAENVAREILRMLKEKANK